MLFGMKAILAVHLIFRESMIALVATLLNGAMSSDKSRQAEKVSQL